jgi:HPt (histidine-containing phosphotransfer) domain-containing protein
LLERISGPKAVPLTALVRCGEVAAQRVQESFSDFLSERIRELTDARYRLAGAPDAAWDQFYALVVDLRGSAAMVSRQDLGEVCRSLESLLKEHVRDFRSAAVVASHIDALILVASGHESEEAVRRLTGELAQAVARIPRKSGALSSH